MIPAALKTLGENVRTLRKRRGLTQEELAERAGLDPSYVQRVEYGTANVGFGKLLKIAVALGASRDDLFLGILDPVPA